MKHTLYPLEQSEWEMHRLCRQGDLWRPLTEHVFKLAGVRSGMRVLDVGCGTGDVSLLVADLVGPHGEIVGVDRDPRLLEMARKRLNNVGTTPASFYLQDLSSLTLTGPFDAVVGRAILLYVKERTKLLRTIKHVLKPGGVAVFQEPDPFLSECVMSHPHTSPLFHQCLTWVRTLFEQTGNDAHISQSLARQFEDASFPSSQMQIMGWIGTPSQTPLYQWMADLIRSQYSLLLQYGITTHEEIGIETLAERLQTEAITSGSSVVTHLLVGIWANKPDEHASPEKSRDALLI